MAKSLHEHAPAIACGLAAFAQCIQRQHAQGIEYVGATEPEGKGMFFEQIHAAGSIAGDLCIRRHMRIRRGMEDPDGRTAPDRSALVRFQQIVTARAKNRGPGVGYFGRQGITQYARELQKRAEARFFYARGQTLSRYATRSSASLFLMRGPTWPATRSHHRFL